MNINKAKFNEVVASAKAKAGSNKRWVAAIDKAADAILDGKWVITELRNCLLITSASEKTYHVTENICQCESFFYNKPCAHRAAARLLSLYNETPDTRASLIADIKANWPSDLNLADELMRRFRRNQLEMLSIDFLTAIRAAI